MRGGVSRYAKILALLPCTSASLAEQTGMSKQSAGRYLRELNRVGLARPAGHESNGKRGFLLRFDHGNGVRCGVPCSIADSVAQAVGLMRGSASVSELAEHMGMSRSGVYKFVRALRDAGMAYISDWRGEAGKLAPAYTYGRGEDVARPKRTPRKVTNARYWAARRAKLQQLQILRALAGAANDEREAA